MPGNFRGHVRPVGTAAAGMHASISNDRKIVRARRHKNQYSIAVARPFHAQFLKGLLRRHHWILNRFATDKDTNLAARLLLRVTYRLDDVLVSQFVQKLCGFHYQLPPAPPPPKLPPPTEKQPPPLPELPPP